jgi:hypothetical protein
MTNLCGVAAVYSQAVKLSPQLLFREVWTTAVREQGSLVARHSALMGLDDAR